MCSLSYILKSKTTSKLFWIPRSNVKCYCWWIRFWKCLTVWNIKGDIPNTFYWYTNTRIIISLDSSAILLILNPYEHDENNTLLQNLKSLLKQVYTETFRILIMNIVELQNLQIWKFFCVGNFNANFRIKRWWAIKIKIYTITACLCLK